MNRADLAAALSQLGIQPRAFILGWMEGRARFQFAGNKDVIAGSILPPGTLGFAASQAAVAFHQALHDGPPP